MLLLVGVYISGAVILSLLDFYFISLSYVIVYVGAVAILFLFIIMMIAPQPNTTSFSSSTLPLLLTGSSILYFTFSPSPLSNIFHINHTSYPSSYAFFYDIQSLGLYLINGWPLAIVMVGILLTSVLLGILDEA